MQLHVQVVVLLLMAPVQLVLFSVLLLTAVAVRAQPSEPFRVEPVIIPEPADSSKSCPASETLVSARNNITEAIQQAFSCGGNSWRHVVDLDMEVASQQCPSPWIEVSTPARSCASSIYFAGCEGVSFPVSGGTYTRVCGRAVGYSILTGDAFTDYTGLGNGNIDNPYVDGISVTHGSPCQHIWSFAVGHGPQYTGVLRCPCDNSNRIQAPLPPSFVGDNYFCDGAYNGALWDGEDCTRACCTFHSPPYFYVTLPASTSDSIEVRICMDQHRHDEALHVKFLQFFVQ